MKSKYFFYLRITMKSRNDIIILLFFLTFSLTAGADDKDLRGFSLGSFQSYKGLGISASLNSIHAFALYADMEGVFSGLTITPGARFSYLYHCPLGDIKAKDGSIFHFYAGPGITTGLMREEVAYGWMGGISGVVGAQVLLRKHFLFSLEFEGDVAYFFSRDGKGSAKMKFYNKGLRYIYFPQLRIEYKF